MALNIDLDLNQQSDGTWQTTVHLLYDKPVNITASDRADAVAQAKAWVITALKNKLGIEIGDVTKYQVMAKYYVEAPMDEAQADF